MVAQFSHLQHSEDCTCKVLNHVHITKSDGYYSFPVFPVVVVDTVDHLLLETLFGTQDTTLLFSGTTSFAAGFVFFVGITTSN